MTSTFIGPGGSAARPGAAVASRSAAPMDHRLGGPPVPSGGVLLPTGREPLFLDDLFVHRHQVEVREEGGDGPAHGATSRGAVIVRAVPRGCNSPPDEHLRGPDRARRVAPSGPSRNSFQWLRDDPREVTCWTPD